MSEFLIGVFDAVGLINSVTPMDPDSGFVTMLNDLRAHGFNAVALNNGSCVAVDRILALADGTEFKIICGPHDELYRSWWNVSVPVTLDAALKIAEPLVAVLSRHPSLHAYNLLDDADGKPVEKVNLMLQAFRQLDPTRPATVVNGWRFNSNTLTADRFDGGCQLVYSYPCGVNQAPCDFYSDGVHSLEDHLRLRMTNDSPAHIILQAHRTTTGPANTQLRYPTVEEMRLQFWIAVGEGAKGIYWFTYHTMPGTAGWTGLRDNPALYAEASDLAWRVAPFDDLLAGLRRVSNVVGAEGDTYTSTLADPEDQLCAVIANRTPEARYVRAAAGDGWQVSDLESGDDNVFGCRGGDGVLCDLFHDPPAGVSRAEVIENGAFAQMDTASRPLAWSCGQKPVTVEALPDHPHALRIQGPQIADAYLPQMLTLKPATRYELSWWVKTEDVAGAGAGVRCQQIAPALVTYGTQYVAGTHDWRQVTWTFRTPANTGANRVDVWFNISNRGTAWVDDIQLCEEG